MRLPVSAMGLCVVCLAQSMASSQSATSRACGRKVEGREGRALKSSFRGSMSVNCRSLGRPPTLWWLLMVWLCFWPEPGRRAGLDDVRVERALDQEAGFGQAAPHQRVRKLLEHLDELLADGLPLLLRVRDALQPGRASSSTVCVIPLCQHGGRR